MKFRLHGRVCVIDKACIKLTLNDYPKRMYIIPPKFMTAKSFIIQRLIVCLATGALYSSLCELVPYYMYQLAFSLVLYSLLVTRPCRMSCYDV